MQPPRGLEEQAAVGRDRGVAAEHVRERRAVGAGRVGALHAAGRAAAGRRAARGSWPDPRPPPRWRARSGPPRRRTARRPRRASFARRPQPGRARGEVGPSVRQPRRDVARRVLRPDARGRRDGPGRRGRAGSAGRRTPPPRPRRRGRLDEVADDLVAGAGDADALARPPAASRSSGRRCRSCRTRAGPGSAGPSDRATRASRRAASSSVSAGIPAGRRRTPGPPAAVARSAGRGRPGPDPSASMPWSATHVPSSRSRSRCWGVPKIPSGTTPSGCGAAGSRLMSTVSPASSTAMSSPQAHAEYLLVGRRGLPLRVVQGPGPAEVELLVGERVPPDAACLSRPRRPARPGRGRRSASARRRAVRRSRSIRRWNSHHVALSSRRCQPRSWARSQRRLLLGRALGRLGRDDRGVRQAVDEGLGRRELASVTSSGKAARGHRAAGTTWPVSVASSTRSPSSQSRSSRLLTTSSRL